jgi:hypothetical protein
VDEEKKEQKGGGGEESKGLRMGKRWNGRMLVESKKVK